MRQFSAGSGLSFVVAVDVTSGGRVVRIFPVRLPSGERYWTVVDETLAVVPVADRFLREERFGRDKAELTTKAHAGGVALFLRWCQRTGRDWGTAATDMGLFITWLKFAPAEPAGDLVVITGPGARPVRQARRINRVLTAVRLFLSSAVPHKDVPPWVLGLLYEVADARDLPVEAQARTPAWCTGWRPGTGSRRRTAWWTGPAMARWWRCCGPAGRRGTG